MKQLTLSTLRIANVARCEHVFHPLKSWTPAEWAVAATGEFGEACNLIKKLRRFDDGTNTAKDPATPQDCIDAIKTEIAGAVIYLDLLAARLGIDLEQAVIDEFNTVSRRMKSNLFL